MAKAQETLKRKIARMTKEARVEAVAVREEGDHFRVTSGLGWRTLRVAKTGTHVYCTCPDKKFRGFREKRLCKHEEAAMRMFPGRFEERRGLLYFTNTAVA